MGSVWLAVPLGDWEQPLGFLSAHGGVNVDVVFVCVWMPAEALSFAENLAC